MELNEYQKKAMGTCMPSCMNYSYMMGNLSAEVGEFQGKVCKAQRHGSISFSNDGDIWWNTDTQSGADVMIEVNQELMKEAGDILWQLAGLCRVMGWNLDDIAQMNLKKLASRQKRGVIDGAGDNR